MSHRDEVLQAFKDDDRPALDRLGWLDVWEACNSWWAPKQRATSRDMTPYAKLLGGEDPKLVLSALEALAGEWRPSPAALRGHLHRADYVEVNVGRGRDPFTTPAALAATTAALDAGEQPCDHAWGPSRFRADPLGVLRCRECSGIQLGQVYAVEDAGLIDQGATS